MQHILALALTASLLAIAPVAVSTHEDSTSDCTLSEPPGEVIDLGGLYINDRGLEDGVWLYLESNEIAGLQLGGTAPLGYDDPDAGELCGHDPDTLLV